MLLCLDVGNTHILGGVFDQDQLIARFRYSTHLIGTSDQLGIFLVNILKENNILPENISATAVCSVVPSCDYTIRHSISTYLSSKLFILQAGVKTGLNIRYKNPSEVGADRIANAIGAVDLFPDMHLIIVDMGTATTICAVTQKKDYLGGTILSGMRLNMEALKNNAAKLMEVNIEKPSYYLGRTTREAIQAGLYYGHLGALREIIYGQKKEIFQNEAVTVIGTGGFSHLFRDAGLFDKIVPDLVLRGLSRAYQFSVTN